MSSVSLISATQPSKSATAKATAQQTAATQTQSSANASSSITISSSGAAYASYEQIIAEKETGRTLRQMALEDPNNPLWMQGAESYTKENLFSPVGGAISLAGKTPNDPASYTNGEPVTVASQAYYSKQAAIYQNQVRELYNTEKAKATAPGQIFADIIDLQAKQPDAFRAMMLWPPVAGPSNIQTASNPISAPEQYLNSGGQIVNS